MRCAACITLLFIFCSMPLSAATIRVPADQPTIQAGIDAAGDGDTVLVADGIFTGEGNRGITFHGYSITLVSENSAASCIIDCESEARGLYFTTGETEHAVLDGFTIKNGAAAEGAGIYCYQSSPSIINCVVQECVAGGEPDRGNGGGIYCLEASPAISGCTITGNHADYSGGGLYLSTNSAPEITNSIIAENSTLKLCAECGGSGVFSKDDSRAEITNCLIYGNQSGDGFGGGVSCLMSDIQLMNCTVAANIAPGGGGVRVVDSFPVLTNCVVWGNLAVDMYDPGHDSIVSYSDIKGGFPGSGNIDLEPIFVEGPKGSYYLSQESSGQNDTSPCVDSGWQSVYANCYQSPLRRMCLNELTTRTDQLTDTGQVDMGYHYPLPEATPTQPPDVIYVPQDYETIQSAINASSDNGSILVSDGVYTGEGNKNLDFNGKEITVSSENGPAYCVIDCELSGRGLYAHRAETDTSEFVGFTIRNGLSAQGAGICCNRSSLSIDQCVLEKGSAITGGGIACFHSSSLISNCLLRDNALITTGDSVFGGGLYCYKSSVIVSTCDISGNTATGDISGNAFGAGIACTQKSTSTLRNCLITDNLADAIPPAETGEAGGIYVTDSTLIIENSTITGNSADRIGGIQHFDSTVEMIDSILWHNSPKEYNSPFTATYSNVNGITGTGNIDADPLFVTGVRGDYYLSQLITGHTIDSPCVDAGSTDGNDIYLYDTRGKFCMDIFVTRNDDNRDRNTVDMGYHYPSRFECDELGVFIDMPDTYFETDDEFYLDVYACNPTPHHFQDLILFLILDVYGEYFFAPSFTDFDYISIDLYPGMQVIELIPPFSWPPGTGAMQGIVLYAAMTDLEMTYLFGQMDMAMFGWSS
jgi:parallel beta-helix repeat protein